MTMSNEPKEFRNMTADEQLKWITDFSKFDEQKLPTLCALGDAWEAAHIKCFEEGLQLLRAFSMCREFVKKSLMFRDYSRRIDRMSFYIDRIKEKIEKGEYVKVGRETLVNVPGMQPASNRRRGRPTKAESAAKAITEGIASEKNKDSFDLFSSVGANTATQEDPALPQLKDVAWLLSPALQSETKQVSFYRAKSAASAEQAKILADKGEKASFIEPYSKEAAEYTEKYKKVYEDVNAELATLYIYLQHDETHADFKAKMEGKGSSIEALKAILLQYSNKMSEEWKAEMTAKIAKEVVKQEEKSVDGSETPEIGKAEKADLLHKHRTYILRKDVKLTPSRIKKVKEKIDELVAIGEDVSEYNVILAKMEEDLAAAQTPKPEEK